MNTLPDYVAFKPVGSVPFENIFTAMTDDFLDVIKSMLVLNPSDRCTCQEALRMDYFRNEPSPTIPSLLPKPSTNSEQSLEEESQRINSASKRPNVYDNEKTAPYVKKLNFDK